MADDTLIPTPALAAALAEITDDPIPSYRVIMDRQRSALWPSTTTKGRHFVRAADLHLVADALGLSPKPRAGTALATVETGEQRLALRREKRGSVEAWSIARQDALDRMNDVVAKWAEYRDSTGDGPSEKPATYYMLFKRMAYSKLGLDQKMKPENLGQIEQAGLVAVFDAVTVVMRDSMAHGLSRVRVKGKYAEMIAIIGAAHRMVIELANAHSSDDEVAE